MFIVIRVDSSLSIGTGHLMRCLTLARALRSAGCEIIFLCRDLPGSLLEVIHQASFEVFLLRKPELSIDHTSDHCQHAGWLGVSYEKECAESHLAISSMVDSRSRMVDLVIIDHYAIDGLWQSTMKNLTQKIFQIDDLADRSHACNILLDQNFYSDMNERYSGLLPTECISLLGPHYALLSPEFLTVKNNIKNYLVRFEQKQVVIFFGGIDSSNQTGLAVEAATQVLDQSYKIKVIIGSKNKNRQMISSLCSVTSNCDLLVQINNMHEVLADSFLFIGAVGATTWERCICELPGLVCTLALNQVNVAKDLHDYGSHVNLGRSDNLTIDSYKSSIRELVSNYEKLESLSITSGSLVDGEGVGRVVKKLVSGINE